MSWLFVLLSEEYLPNLPEALIPPDIVQETK